MAKGSVYPSESVALPAAPSGARMRQVTGHPSIHHHPFYYIPAYDAAMQWLFFVSHRTGHPQLFAEERSSGKLIQLTERTDLNEWSIHPSYDGRSVYFTAGCGAWRVSTDGFKEECLADFGEVPMIARGMVGDAMGTTSLSGDDRWWAVPVKMGRTARLHTIDTQSGDCQAILEGPSIGHPQFHPDDPGLLRYGGRHDERIWVARRDGSENRLAYQRDATRKEWIVHESWIPGTTEILAANWPHGLIAIDTATGQSRRLTRFPAWHPMIDRRGDTVVADTKNPDTGLHLIDLITGSASPLCPSESSNAGDHWNTDHCPYDDGPVDVYAPQHTHPHPHFSPDRRLVVFTTDRTGSSQLVEVVRPPEAAS